MWKDSGFPIWIRKKKKKKNCPSDLERELPGLQPMAGSQDAPGVRRAQAVYTGGSRSESLSDLRPVSLQREMSLGGCASLQEDRI